MYDMIEFKNSSVIANLHHREWIVEVHVSIDVVLHSFFQSFRSVVGSYQIRTHSSLVVAEVQLRHRKRFLYE